ncbi:MAG: BamA/TamA family outer membrane protein [Candidatus Didemnitutus sp.]|nr:BamA/TamA family outer membrane protein [Candidatus Didemnitutus sp.]
MTRSNRSSLPRAAARLAMLVLLGTLPLAGAELRVSGLNWFGNRTAAQRLHLLLGDKSGPVLDASTIEDNALVLLSATHEDGYLAAKLTVEATLADGRVERYPLDARLEPPLPRPLAATAVTLHLERGPRFTVHEISFSGLSALTVKEARTFFVGDDLMLPLAGTRIYSPGRLRNSTGNLEEALRQQGYAEGEVTSSEVSTDPATGRVSVKVVVQEGRRWVVEEVKFAISDASEAPDDVIAGRLAKAWNSPWRQDTATAIRRWYYNRGHPDVTVTLTAQTTDRSDGTKAVTVLAAVQPGPEVRVGAVRFEGNRYTREATLRRFVRSGPGELLDPVVFNDSQVRLSQLGVFRAVDLRYESVDDHTRDAVYAITEGRRQEINLLAGYGSYEQLRGGIEWRHYNLVGRAHTGVLRLSQSMKSSQGDYTYAVPELFGTPLTGTGGVFGLNRQELSYVHEEYGANVTAIWPVRLLGFALTTGYTFKHVLDTDNELATSASDQAQVNVGSFNVGLVRDRRDNSLRPRQGYRLSLQGELADRTLGGETIYQQLVLAASYHTGWGGGRWIHLGVSHGVVTTFGASDDSGLPVSVRFFPGGEDSIRGFRRGGAAPRADNGLFAGAKSYLQSNLELEQAFTANWSVVAFVDALGTAARMADYPVADWLYSAGLGVRYQTIIGPVRVEYGHNLNPRPLDPSGTLLVSIGFPF